MSSFRSGCGDFRAAAGRGRRRSALVLVLASMINCSCEPTPRDGVILITIDTLRADALGAFGRSDARTTVLDQLAEQGVRADAYTPIPLTLPAHTGIELLI